MKKNSILFSTICATALLYISCSTNDEITNQTDVTAVAASVAIDATNEIDINTALVVTSGNSPTAKNDENQAEVCATITVVGTTYPKVFTVDYGTTGCTDNQIIRKGKLEITLSGPVITTGSKMTIKRIDYSINGIKLEGTIELSIPQI